MTYKVNEQLEKILDEEKGNRLSVIVRMASSDEKDQNKNESLLLEIASDGIRQRNISMSARDLLPDTQLNRQRKRSSIKQTLTTDSTNELRKIGLNYIEPLLSSEIVNSEQSKKEQKNIQSFWTSRSVYLNVLKDDLRKLLDEVPQIRSIYPNRVLKVPKLVEVKNLPPVVLENKTSSWGIQKIGALAAWGAYNARGEGVKVGLLDTGVDSKHPDLDGKISSWAEFDENGKLIQDSTPYDSDQHGTHCAGIIAGGNASGQWIGVAPEAKLAVALVLNGKNGGTDAQVLAGIDWLVEQNVDVISMSLGGLTLGPETPSTYTEAILTCLTAGIPVVTAIGNEGNQTTGSPGNDIFAYSVGATDYYDRAAGFSGGRTHIIRQSSFIPPEQLPIPYSKPDVVAPGVAIRSSIPEMKWGAFNGTSMATPHVAGAIALLLSATSIRNRTKADQKAILIQNLLTGSVDELGESGQDHRFGFGRIDVLRAIGFAIERGYGNS